MRRLSRTLLLSLSAAAVVLSVVRVHAITYGLLDTSNAFSNTGAFIVKAPGGPIYPICSGTLIAPDVFLTASHCTLYYQQALAPAGYVAFVSFDTSIPFGDLTSGSTNLVTVTGVFTNPLYNRSQKDSGDIAVLTVDPAQTGGITPAVLPTAHLLDLLSEKNGLKNAVFYPVGYGLQNRVVGGGNPYFTDANPVPRLYAFSPFNALSPGYLRLSQNPSPGKHTVSLIGGTCFGDSGGPNFLDVNGTLTLVAITITGDAVCRSANVDYRLDTDAARAFLTPWVTLP